MAWIQQNAHPVPMIQACTSVVVLKMPLFRLSDGTYNMEKLLYSYIHLQNYIILQYSRVIYDDILQKLQLKKADSSKKVEIGILLDKVNEEKLDEVIKLLRTKKCVDSKR